MTPRRLGLLLILPLAACATPSAPAHFVLTGDEILAATIRADTSNCDPVHFGCAYPADHGLATCNFVNSYLLEATCEQVAKDYEGEPFVIVTMLERKTSYSEWLTSGPAVTYRPQTD